MIENKKGQVPYIILQFLEYVQSSIYNNLQ